MGARPLPVPKRIRTAEREPACNESAKTFSRTPGEDHQLIELVEAWAVLPAADASGLGPDSGRPEGPLPPGTGDSVPGPLTKEQVPFQAALRGAQVSFSSPTAAPLGGALQGGCGRCLERWAPLLPAATPLAREERAEEVGRRRWVALHAHDGTRHQGGSRRKPSQEGERGRPQRPQHKNQGDKATALLPRQSLDTARSLGGRHGLAWRPGKRRTWENHQSINQYFCAPPPPRTHLDAFSRTRRPAGRPRSPPRPPTSPGAPPPRRGRPARRAAGPGPGA